MGFLRGEIDGQYTQNAPLVKNKYPDPTCFGSLRVSGGK